MFVLFLYTSRLRAIVLAVSLKQMQRHGGIVLVVGTNQEDVIGLFAKALQATVTLFNELRQIVIVRVALQQRAELANCGLSVLEQNARNDGDQFRVGEIGNSKRVQADRFLYEDFAGILDIQQPHRAIEEFC